jgi:hypothetical protein
MPTTIGSVFGRLFAKLFGADHRLSELEMMVLDKVKENLDPRLREIWERQVQAINKIQRLCRGVEVNFYHLENGRPSFDESLLFQNRTEELLVAKIKIKLPGMGKLGAKVWCVKGHIFQIEYNTKGVGVDCFEEAAGMDPQPEFELACELVGDLAAT